MSEGSHVSAGISPRRRIIAEVLEEVLAVRSEAVARLPVEEQDPPASSALWPAGATRLAVRRSRDGALGLADGRTRTGRTC